MPRMMDIAPRFTSVDPATGMTEDELSQIMDYLNGVGATAPAPARRRALTPEEVAEQRGMVHHNTGQPHDGGTLDDLMSSVGQFAVDVGSEAKRQGQQLYKGVLEATGPNLMELGGLIVAGPELLRNWVSGQNGDPKSTIEAFTLAEQMHQNADTLAGSPGEARNIIERGLNIVPQFVAPVGGPKTTALVAGGFSLPSILGFGEPDTASADNVVNDNTTVEPEKGGDWAPLAVLAGLTSAMMFGPKIASRVFRGQLPRFRPVTDAAPGTESVTNRLDLARTYDDANAGVIRIARRIGVPTNEIDHLINNFRMNTRAAALSLGDAAVLTGNAEGAGLRFAAKTPISVLHRQDNADVSRYMDYRNRLDLLMIQQAKGRAQLTQSGRLRKGAVPVRTDIRGMDERSLLAEINRMERANPQLLAFSAAYRDNMRQLRRFQARGEYAVMTTKEERRRNAMRRYEVPERGGDVLGDVTHDTGSVTMHLADATRFGIKQRLENEAIGTYIDAIRRQSPSLARRITPRQLTENPHWKPRVVTFYRRGKKELYTTDGFIADMMNIDPYYFHNQAGNAFYSTKRLLETGTTGRLAPWFASTSAIRSQQIMHQTVPTVLGSNGKPLKAPNVLQSVAAIPQQLAPKLANAIAQSLDAGSGGWLANTFGAVGQSGLAARLAQTLDDFWKNSQVAWTERFGSTRGNIMEGQARRALRQGRSAFDQPGVMSTVLRSLGSGYMDILEAIHNAPAFAMARRNRGRMNDAELMEQARHATGNPKIAGQTMTAEGSRIRGPVVTHNIPRGRFDVPESLQDTALKLYGDATEFGRAYVPWYNVSMQGMKRLGEAYLRNPMKFTANMWLYTMLPSAVGYLWNRAVSGQGEGEYDYNDYQMNRRSSYNRGMSQYFAIPGSPPEDGIELPRFHEFSLPARMMEDALHHLFGDAVMTTQEDWQRAMGGFIQNALTPAMPPVVGALGGLSGVQMPMGVFGDQAYIPRSEPFDNTGFPHSVELAVRALGGGIGDIIGSMASTYSTSEDDVATALGQALSSGAEGVVRRTPIVRDILGVKPTMSGATEVTDELFRKQARIDDLVAYMRDSDAEVNTKAASNEGGDLMDVIFGGPPPNESAGLARTPPTNSLYVRFADTVYNRFISDTSEHGGIGFKSAWRRYGDFGEHLRHLRRVNPANYSRWQLELQTRPELLAWLKERGVDYSDPKKVINAMTRERQDVGMVLLEMVHSVEREMSTALHRPITLEDLDPYGDPGRLMVPTMP